MLRPTDAPGCRETVVDGENGFLAPIKSVNCLFEVMLLFIVEPGLVFYIGKRSWGIAEDKYDARKVNIIMLREIGIMQSV